MIKIFLRILPFLVLCNVVFGQTGGIKFKVIDSATRQTLRSAIVLISKDNIQFAAISTDVNGYCELKPLDPGNYDARIVYKRYKEAFVKNIHVSKDSVSHIEISMTPIMDTARQMLTNSINEYMKCDDWLASHYYMPGIPVHCTGMRVHFIEEDLGRCWSTGVFYKGDIARLPSNDIGYVLDFFPLSKLNGFPTR